MNINTISIFCLIIQFALTNAQQLLTITSVDTFPHFIDNSFSIGIQALANGNKLSTDPSDTMVIRIVDAKANEMDRFLIYYGSLHFMDEKVQKKFMKINNWEKNPSSTSMNISIMFNRGAHKKYLEIFYFSTPNALQRKKYLKDPSLGKRLFQELIELFVPSTLALSVIPMQNERKEINKNDLVMASCKAFDGIPHYEPRFDNYARLNVTETKYNKTANEIRMTFCASIRDHLTNFSCSAGNVTETFTLRIHHHPTALYIHPIINKRFRSNSTIKCYTSDGYPDPEINWQLIEGPLNAERFYNITEKGHQININSNSPTGSKWTFNCTMKSNLVNTKKILNKTISFAIAKNPMEICGEKCLNARISAIEESVEENGKLHEDMRLVLREVKEQMRRGQQEMSAGLRDSNKQVKEQMKAMRKEQQEISNNTQKQFENIKNYINYYDYNKAPIRFTFDRITYVIQWSPFISTIHSLSVLIWTFFSGETFRIYLIFRGPSTISVDLNIQCQINAVKTPAVTKTVTFNVQYRGQYVNSNVMKYPTRETFGSDLTDTRFTVACRFI